MEEAHQKDERKLTMADIEPCYYATTFMRARLATRLGQPQPLVTDLSVNACELDMDNAYALELGMKVIKRDFKAVSCLVVSSSFRRDKDQPNVNLPTAKESDDNKRRLAKIMKQLRSKDIKLQAVHFDHQALTVHGDDLKLLMKQQPGQPPIRELGLGASCLTHPSFQTMVAIKDFLQDKRCKIEVLVVSAYTGAKNFLTSRFTEAMALAVRPSPKLKHFVIKTSHYTRWSDEPTGVEAICSLRLFSNAKTLELDGLTQRFNNASTDKWGGGLSEVSINACLNMLPSS